MMYQINQIESFTMLETLREFLTEIDIICNKIHELDDDFDNTLNLYIYNDLKSVKTDIYMIQNLIIQNTEKPLE